MTSNSLKGANDYYTAYGRTTENLFEADVGSVDVYDSTVTKKSINGIREICMKINYMDLWKI